MTKNIKAVIMDGDGSTITIQDKVFPDNLRQLIMANPQIKWIMATGRSLDLLRLLPIIDHLSPDVPHILDGGSRLNHIDGTVFEDYFLSPEELEHFFQQLDLGKINFLYYYLDEEHSFFYSENIELWRDHLTFIHAQTTSDFIQFKAWCYQFPPTKIFIRVKEEITLQGLTWHQNEKNIDLTASGVSKGSSCIKLLEHLRISPAEAVFVFNDRNDLPLVEHPLLAAITKIKVGDYLPDVVADYSVATPYEVAAVLKQLINT
jgi:hydroxymethylpyrimidine pyrophosphatase-like HAD family hydrolase